MSMFKQVLDCKDISQLSSLKEAFKYEHAPKLSEQIVAGLHNLIRLGVQQHNVEPVIDLVLDIFDSSLNNNDYTTEDWIPLTKSTTSLIKLMLKIFYQCQQVDNSKIASIYKHIVIKAAVTLLPLGERYKCFKSVFFDNLTNPILLLICADKLDFYQRKNIFLSYKRILDKISRSQRQRMLAENANVFPSLVRWLITCGDYETQENLVNFVVTTAYSDQKQMENLVEWFSKFPQLSPALKILDKDNLLITCRNFLIAINRIAKVNFPVFCHPCLAAYANEILLQKPQDDQYTDFWIDFSARTGTVQITFDGGHKEWVTFEINYENVKGITWSKVKYPSGFAEQSCKKFTIDLFNQINLNHSNIEINVLVVSLIFVDDLQFAKVFNGFFMKCYGDLLMELQFPGEKRSTSRKAKPDTASVISSVRTASPVGKNAASSLRSGLPAKASTPERCDNLTFFEEDMTSKSYHSWATPLLNSQSNEHNSETSKKQEDKELNQPKTQWNQWHNQDVPKFKAPSSLPVRQRTSSESSNKGNEHMKIKFKRTFAFDDSDSDNVSVSNNVSQNRFKPIKSNSVNIAKNIQERSEPTRMNDNQELPFGDSDSNNDVHFVSNVSQYKVIPTIRDNVNSIQERRRRTEMNNERKFAFGESDSDDGASVNVGSLNKNSPIKRNDTVNNIQKSNGLFAKQYTQFRCPPPPVFSESDSSAGFAVDPNRTKIRRGSGDSKESRKRKIESDAKDSESDFEFKRPALADVKNTCETKKQTPKDKGDGNSNDSFVDPFQFNPSCPPITTYQSKRKTPYKRKEANKNWVSDASPLSSSKFPTSTPTYKMKINPMQKQKRQLFNPKVSYISEDEMNVVEETKLNEETKITEERKFFLGNKGSTSYLNENTNTLFVDLSDIEDSHTKNTNTKKKASSAKKSKKATPTATKSNPPNVRKSARKKKSTANYKEISTGSESELTTQSENIKAKLDLIRSQSNQDDVTHDTGEKHEIPDNNEFVKQPCSPEASTKITVDHTLSPPDPVPSVSEPIENIPEVEKFFSPPEDPEVCKAKKKLVVVEKSLNSHTPNVTTNEATANNLTVSQDITTIRDTRQPTRGTIKTNGLKFSLEGRLQGFCDSITAILNETFDEFQDIIIKSDCKIILESLKSRMSALFEEETKSHKLLDEEVENVLKYSQGLMKSIEKIMSFQKDYNNQLEARQGLLALVVKKWEQVSKLSNESGVIIAELKDKASRKVIDLHLANNNAKEHKLVSKKTSKDKKTKLNKC